MQIGIVAKKVGSNADVIGFNERNTLLRAAARQEATTRLE